MDDHLLMTDGHLLMTNNAIGAIEETREILDALGCPGHEVCCGGPGIEFKGYCRDHTPEVCHRFFGAVGPCQCPCHYGPDRALPSRKI